MPPDVEQLVSDALAPIRSARADVIAELEELEAKVADKKATRDRLTRAIRALDPNEPGPGRSTNNSKPAPKPSGSISDATVAKLEEHLREHYASEEFWAQGVLDDPRLDGLMSSYSVTRAIGVLSDRGVIRLDHLDRTTHRKLYRLTS